MKLVTLITDFGTSDYYVGAMKGVILSVSPDVQLVDITHSIAPYDKVHAAYVLRQIWSTFPRGTVHVAVVDPEVGTARKIIVGRCEGRFFVTPDNGLMSFVARESRIDEVYYAEADSYFLAPVSSTFHGRDKIAPLAGHLVKGVPLKAFGSVCDAMNSLKMPLLGELKGDLLVGRVLFIDHFGTLISNIHTSQLSMLARDGGKMNVCVDEEPIGMVAKTFEDVPQGEFVSYVGSGGYLEIAMNRGRADSHFSKSADVQVHIS